MTRLAFADTGFWIALLDARDEHHSQAQAGLHLAESEYRLTISDFVLYETITYLNCSIKRHDLAVRFIESIHKAGFRVFEVDGPVKADALDIFVKYSDKNFSFTDCATFVLMRREGIDEYFGFDDHFAQMGLRPAFA